MGKLNREYALSCKGILDFGGLGIDGKELHFSDIDGIHTTKRTKVIIEEKYHWRSYSNDSFFIKDEIDFDKRPSILLMTQNPKDIKNLPYEEKIIEMKDSIVLETYDNTGGKFAKFLIERDLRFELSNLYGTFKINNFLKYWFMFLKETQS
ncbi:MAG: hypothetical protein ACTTJ1_08715 [Treponema sp.]